jgi:hypothetical protein
MVDMQILFKYFLLIKKCDVDQYLFFLISNAQTLVFPQFLFLGIDKSVTQINIFYL